ncbi:ABC transporter substrate-binding protein [Pseudalkalibacillus hwajinpoensis]|uniref:Iron-siderophore ABC transporter substrate-binding protein n=1 Tax=Guptibacillus hwajinpoensis TaxID=208199 RepID=A0A4U1MIX3_9BACL|nr:iron-siderophore ABC transporter substrate-binding protein [Pseudalkalibacillus hwajinpoensis]TKD70495.1 iron-siderophore ABC transporter substrate-binding protein [Pseudalkalibacillus hwajinpoensis]
MHKKGWMIITLAMIMILAACGTSGNNASEDNSGDQKEEQATRTVSHAMGETEVPENPEKVVILTNEGTEALLAMDVTPVGAVQSWLGDPWYEHISDKMKGVEVVGTESEVNLEAVAALKPDLIIGNKLRQEDIYDQLSAIAPTVYSETLKGDWQENFTFYANAMNMKDKGDEVMSAYSDRIDSMSKDLGDQLDKEVSVVRFLAGQTRMYYKDSFSGVILEQLGFDRPESQQKNDFAEEVTKERIPEMDGDVLFYFTYDAGDGDANSTAKEWTNDPLWNNLEVVKEDNVHEVSDAIWNTSGGVISANKMLDDIEDVFLSK